MRGIRHILGIEHAYWSRTSNEEILMKANWILEHAEDITAEWKEFIIPRNENVKRIKLVSEILEDKKIKLLGHVMRCEKTDPLYQVTLTDQGGFNVYMKQRVGRPRGHWAEDVMNKAMLQLTGKNSIGMIMTITFS